MLVLMASLLVTRAIQTITGTSKLTFLPYVFATFLILAPMLVFTQGLVQIVTGIVFVSLVGIAGFYWIVAILVHHVKSTLMKN